MIGALLAAAAAVYAADPASARHYSLRLNAVITPEAQTMGLYFKARIDGGPVLRMLLDSGAQHIVLDKRAAAKVGRTAGSDFELVGVGASARTCRRAVPGTVEIGDLVLENCDILVVDGQVLEGVDGVIPLSLFANFLVRLDLPGKKLELDAYPADPPVSDASYLPARTDNRLFFLRSVLNEKHSGYVLLDTGATFNALSPEAARASRNYWSLANAISLRGSAGGIEGFQLPAGVRFRCGDRVLSGDPAVVVDLSDFARHHRFEITGILGYPALRNSIVTIDYRDSLVRIEGR
jgi:predicted aspartyl protease